MKFAPALAQWGQADLSGQNSNQTFQPALLHLGSQNM